MIVEALAGTGKTSTLVKAAEQLSGKVIYTAFNKKIVTEAKQKFDGIARVSTVHGLAFRTHGMPFKDRFDSPRMPQHKIGQRLGAKSVRVTLDDGTQRGYSPGFVAGQAVATVRRFCQSDSQNIGPEHVPPLVDLALDPATWSWWCSHVIPFAESVWEDGTDPNGTLPYDHAYYLKEWQLSAPTLNCDTLMFDEAQDVSPVMASVIMTQPCQLVMVGDPNQAIYGFTGAIDALARIRKEAPTIPVGEITQSFRFGETIASVANYQLAALTNLRLIGAGPNGSVHGTGPAPGAPDAVLCRTNAGAMTVALDHKEAGGDPHVMGGTAEMVRFARAAGELMALGSSDHPDLGCFQSWQQVLDYVEEDALGFELALSVDLVEKFGWETIAAMANQPYESDATLITSTAHKVKGAQWPSVRLHHDFGMVPDKEITLEEIRLLYVAATRAQTCLDVSEVPKEFGFRPPEPTNNQQPTNPKDNNNG